MLANGRFLLVLRECSDTRPLARYVHSIGIGIFQLPYSPCGSQVQEVGEQAPEKADARVD
jgi:hypothetical protein